MVPLNPQRGLIRCKLISNETVTPRIGSGRSQGFTDFPFIHREGWKEREGRGARESETKWRAGNSVKREGERQREGEPGSSIDRLLSSSVPATEPVGSSCSWNLLLPFSYVRLPLSLSLSSLCPSLGRCTSFPCSLRVSSLALRLAMVNSWHFVLRQFQRKAQMSFDAC